MNRWSRPHLAAVAVGFMVLALGAAGTRQQDAVNDQILWLNVTITGSLAVGVALGSHFIGYRRAVEQQRALVVEQLIARTSLPAAAPSAGDASLVAATGQRRFHVASCPLVTGKAATEARSRQAHERRGLQPCGVCRP